MTTGITGGMVATLIVMKSAALALMIVNTIEADDGDEIRDDGGDPEYSNGNIHDPDFYIFVLVSTHEALENVTHFNYLGANIEADGKITPDIRKRLAIATSKLKSMMNIWKSQSTPLKMRILKSCIFPVATYGCETDANKKDVEKIDAFEMKCYRKILRIPWTARRTNQNILQELGMKERQLLKNIKQLKLKYFGHVVRHNNLEKLCLEGAVEGRRGRGRPRRRWTQDISDWLGFSVREASILAQDRRFPLSCVGGYVLQGSAMKKRSTHIHIYIHIYYINTDILYVKYTYNYVHLSFATKIST
ncbi:endonuclease-reverse transcriptase [Elysia marginata]|uniref:Endonuclease-reverse transcriptase n=1 Tax=Elysia marginata TaxID=1093978 RepID=A0AAV4F0B3_9GAST|nr:endonuclease-reverse transcriptase [Elysia marginata]